jgi:hypothetical protein
MFIDCTNQATKTPEEIQRGQGFSPGELRDDWHAWELLGDKVFGNVTMKLLKTYNISHTWTAFLVHSLTSNKYQIALCDAIGLSDALLTLALGKKGEADVLEVYLFLIKLIKVYFALLTEDPLYLCTEHSATEYITRYLEQTWKPLLIYTQELYGPPIQINGLTTPGFTCQLSRYEIFGAGANFTYSVKPGCPAFETLICSSLNSTPWGGAQATHRKPKSGFIITLTVEVPRNSDDPFWHFDHILSDKFFWAKSNDSLAATICVSSWGPTDLYARYYSTQRVMDIIRTIRKSLYHPLQFPNSEYRSDFQLLSRLSRRTRIEPEVASVTDLVHSNGTQYIRI